MRKRGSGLTGKTWQGLKGNKNQCASAKILIHDPAISSKEIIKKADPDNWISLFSF